ncbi:PQQ-binding-like beta-propeller repeat protein [Asanoa sp. NPDC049573]|uniref:outer membrane protein assembly factor BamB family protein n=1 Tax=Asanoa sp. NPDC049573 TaxID=3155396 RepID=UPI00343F73D5
MTRSNELGVRPVVGFGPAGRHGHVIEIERDRDWQPPEPQPWSTRTRLIATALALALAAGVYFAGVARPSSLAPMLLRVGTAEALALDDSRAYVSGGNMIRAYDLGAGTQLWSVRVVGLSSLLTLGDDRLVVATVDVGQRPSVEVLDALTGAVVWHRQTRFVGIAGDVVVVNGPAEGDRVPLRGLSVTDGTPRWTAVLEPTVTIAGDARTLRSSQVEVSPGHLRVRDLASGRIVVDTPQTATGPPESATVVGGTALLVDQKNMITAYDTGDGRSLWRVPLPVVGVYSAFGDCGSYICHINDRGTVALDRLTGRQAWRSTKRYLSVPVDEEHMFVAETFGGFEGPGTAVLDPRNGEVRADPAPWRALGVIDGAELLVWRYDGPRQQLLGLFDAYSARTRIIGRADGWIVPPTCVTSLRHVLCADAFDFAVWPR